MNEVFGEENFVATIIWQKVYSPKNSAKHFSEDHDYIVCYARNGQDWRPNQLERSDEAVARYSNPDEDSRGPWKSVDLSARNFYGAGTYPITCPSGRVVPGPPAGRYWSTSKQSFEELLHDRRIWWGVDGDANPSVKRFLSEVKAGVVPQTLWHYQAVGHSQEAKKQLLELVDFASSDSVFDTPKPARLIERMLQIGTTALGEDLVLDFFAGSGTTAEAVMRTNKADGGNRRFVLVQLPELLDDPKVPSISSLARQRVISAAKKIVTQPAQLGETIPDFGFRSYHLTSSNFLVWDGTSKPAEQLQVGLGALAENVVAGRTQDDLAVELLLKLGFPMNTAVSTEVVAGKTVYSAADGAVMFFLDDRISIEIIEWMVEKDPARIVVLEAAFGGDDELKVNAVQTVRAKAAGKQSEMVLKVV